MGAFDPSQGNGSDASGVLDGAAVRTNIPDSSLTQTTPNVRDFKGVFRSFIPNNRSTSLGQGSVSPFFGASSLGAYASALAQGATAIGYHAIARVAQSCALGNQAQAQAYRAVAIGSFANAPAINAMALGPYAYANYMNSLAVGPGARTSAVNQAVFGGEGSGYTDVWFGQGNTVGLAGGTVGNYTIHGEESQTANTTGGEIKIAGGRSTGTARGGAVRLQASNSVATGTTIATLYDRYVIPARKALTNNTTTEMFRLSLPNPGSVAFEVKIGLSITDATNVVSYSATANVAATHDGSGYLSTITTTGATTQLGGGGSALAVTLSITQPATDIIAFNVKSNTTVITPSSTLCFIEIIINGEQTVTLV